MYNPTIGLFGTCGGSNWRDSFITQYNKLGIHYFNPQKNNWKPEDAIVEAEHLIEDDIILFPVTNETYGTGSLAETGFSIHQAIRSNLNRSIVVMIDINIKPELVIADPIAAKESMRSRALVQAHLNKVKHDNIYIVESLEDMFTLSLKLYDLHKQLAVVRQYSINR